MVFGHPWWNEARNWNRLFWKRVQQYFKSNEQSVELKKECITLVQKKTVSRPKLLKLNFCNPMMSEIFFVPLFINIFPFFSEFVCSIKDNLSFLSGCHAGCSSIVDKKNYGNCSCLSNPETPQLETLVTLGTCSSNCNYVYLAVILFFQVLFTFMGMIPGLVAGLR